MSYSIDYLKQLIPIANPSRGEHEIRQFILDTISVLPNIKFESHVDEMGNLLVHLHGDKSARASVAFCAHLDSVPPCAGITFEEAQDDNDGPIIRPTSETILGTDDKSGIAVILALFKRLSEQDNHHYPTLEFIFSVQEEIGICGTKALDFNKLHAKNIIVLDGEGLAGHIFNQGMSRQAITISIYGKACHAAFPECGGINAIQLMAEVLAAFPESGRISPITTMNYGFIEGGNSINTVPAFCKLSAELRSFDDTMLDEINTQMVNACAVVEAKHEGSKITCDIQTAYPVFTISEDAEVVQICKAACEKVGVQPQVLPMLIGSDAHIFNVRGCQAIVLGMGFSKSHTSREFIRLKDFAAVEEIAWQIIFHESTSGP